MVVRRKNFNGVVVCGMGGLHWKLDKLADVGVAASLVVVWGWLLFLAPQSGQNLTVLESLAPQLLQYMFNILLR